MIEAAPVHHAARRCGGGVAARGARAAAGEGSPRRFGERSIEVSTEYFGFRAAISGDRL